MLSLPAVVVRVVGILLLLAIAHGPAFAQQAAARPRGEPDVPEKAGKELVAHYVGDTPPRIDGEIDDEIWQQAQAIDDMVQNDPNNMQPPTERTLVKVAYDDRSVYVAVMNYMTRPGAGLPTRSAAATPSRAAIRSRSPSTRATIT